MFRALKEVVPTETLTAWSDNCAGQNKNKMLLFLWIYLTCIGLYKEVNHKFLVGGHSFLNCDRDFALIEKHKRLLKCIVPNDLKTLIQDVKEIKPFIVNIMEESHFFILKWQQKIHQHQTCKNIYNILVKSIRRKTWNYSGKENL